MLNNYTVLMQCLPNATLCNAEYTKNKQNRVNIWKNQQIQENA